MTFNVSVCSLGCVLMAFSVFLQVEVLQEEADGRNPSEGGEHDVQGFIGHKTKASCSSYLIALHVSQESSFDILQSPAEA